MTIGAVEITLLLGIAMFLFAQAIRQFPLLRWTVAALVAANLFTMMACAADGSAAPSTPALEGSEARGKTSAAATLEDGERDWGRDPGIGTQLSPTSMVIAAVGSAVMIGLTTWLIFYQKPDGTVHPYDEG